MPSPLKEVSMAWKCMHCSRETEPSATNQWVCESCLAIKLEAEAHPVRAIPVHGCSDGPGSACNEIIFDRPDPKKDIPLTIRRMEAGGQLDTPKKQYFAQVKMDAAAKMNRSKTDYQKGGHPLEGLNH